MPRITGVAPFFLVADVVRAAEHYRDKLGFKIVGCFLEDPPVFAMSGATTRSSCCRGWAAPGAAVLDTYLWVTDVEALHREFQ